MKILKRFARRENSPVNDRYVTSAPSPQNAVDIFKGEWSSRLPLAGLETGKAELFEDHRISWLISEAGGIEGKRVLELGPLEAGHSWMLEQGGAGSVIAVEANTQAYLKCLIAKELLGMRKVTFLCGDFVEYLRDPACPEFDIGVASGVLYHMENPVELIALLAERCGTHLFLWTHYYDRAWAKAKKLQHKFPAERVDEHAGFRHTLVQQNYEDEVLGWKGFCGGSRPRSSWMYRDDILRCLSHFGFPDIRIGFDHPEHQNGPAFAIVAGRG